jgi:uncharacterized protein YdhG (YjbR/CyaY superfamily)
MVQSKARTVDEYLGELPPERRVALQRMREIALRSLRGFQEGMEYGMPIYRRSPTEGVAFASQRRYVSVYPGVEVLTAFRRDLIGHDVGKGCIRFPSPEQIDWALVERIFKAVAKA